MLYSLVDEKYWIVASPCLPVAPTTRTVFMFAVIPVFCRWLWSFFLSCGLIVDLEGPAVLSYMDKREW